MNVTLAETFKKGFSSFLESQSTFMGSGKDANRLFQCENKILHILYEQYNVKNEAESRSTLFYHY